MTWFLKNAGDDDENGCVDCNDFFIGPMYAKWCHLVAKFGFNETTPVTDPIVWIRSISGNISLCVFSLLLVRTGSMPLSHVTLRQGVAAPVTPEAGELEQNMTNLLLFTPHDHFVVSHHHIIF